MRNHRLRVRPATLLGLFVLIGLSQTTAAADLGRCTGIVAAGARLACYDRIAGAQAPAESRHGRWQSRQEPAETPGYTNVYLMTAADAGGHGQPPTLYLRCRENVTAAIIDWGTHIGTQPPRIRYRVDGGPERAAIWDTSTTHRASGLFIGRDSIPFVKSLFGGQRLVAQVESPTRGLVTAAFDIRGVETAVQPLRKACHW